MAQQTRSSRSSARDLLDELYLHVTPMVFGRGERLLENIDHPKPAPVVVVASPSVNHIRLLDFPRGVHRSPVRP